MKNYVNGLIIWLALLALPASAFADYTNAVTNLTTNDAGKHIVLVGKVARIDADGFSRANYCVTMENGVRVKFSGGIVADDERQIVLMRGGIGSGNILCMVDKIVHTVVHGHAALPERKVLMQCGDRITAVGVVLMQGRTPVLDASVLQLAGASGVTHKEQAVGKHGSI